MILACMGQQATANTHINIPSRTCDVTRYGADGSHQQIRLNTDAIQKAIDDCAAEGGGTVRVPAGNYLTAPLFLKSNIRLQLDKNATLVASSVESSWRATEATRYAMGDKGWLPFISVADSHNVAITGEGTIDGQGAVWWERWRDAVRHDWSKRRSTNRPRLIYVLNSQNVLIKGVTIKNSPSFHVVLRNTEDVDITHTHILAPWHAPNTDAIDPMDSHNVRITHNYIDCNDDHVAIKAVKPDPKHPEGSVSNIYIAYNTLMQGRGISIGSETSGGVNGVLAEHNTFENAMYGLRIKSRRGKGGAVRNVVYRDTRMINVETPLLFTGYYTGSPTDSAELRKQLEAGSFIIGDQIFPPDTDPAVEFNEVKTPHYSNIKVERLLSTGKTKAAGYIFGLPEALFTGFEFDDVRIEADQGLLIRNADVKTRKFNLKVHQGKPVRLEKGGKLH